MYLDSGNIHMFMNTQNLNIFMRNTESNKTFKDTQSAYHGNIFFLPAPVLYQGLGDLRQHGYKG